MKVQEFRFYRMEINQVEMETLQGLVSEGLSYTEDVTAAMASIAESLGLSIVEAPAEKLASKIRRDRKRNTTPATPINDE